MAEVNPIHYALVVQDRPAEPENIDLIRRYCPGLAVHTHAEVAKHIQVDAHGCWPWDGNRDEYGYGYVYCGQTPYGLPQSVRVQRYMYDLLVGPIPEGHHVHHRCEDKPCWHPLHLEAVTPTEHKARHKR